MSSGQGLSTVNVDCLKLTFNIHHQQQHASTTHAQRATFVLLGVLHKPPIYCTVHNNGLSILYDLQYIKMQFHSQPERYDKIRDDFFFGFDVFNRYLRSHIVYYLLRSHKFIISYIYSLTTPCDTVCDLYFERIYKADDTLDLNHSRFLNSCLQNGPCCVYTDPSTEYLWKFRNTEPSQCGNAVEFHVPLARHIKLVGPVIR